MKKLLLTAAIAVLGFTNVNAQEREAGAIEVIPYIGYSGSFFNGDNSDAYETRNSVSFGVKGDYFFNDRWSLRSGLNFDSMGSAIKNQNNDVKLNYLSIPVNANWHFGSTRKWNLNFGVTPSFLLSAEQENNGDIDDQVKGFQFGISYGIGYKLEISDNFSILFDAQGLVGITNIVDIENSDLDQMNATSHFGIGGVFSF